MYQVVRGTVDILPQEQAYWRYIEQQAAYICKLYGYTRIDTPVLENTSLFTRSIGERTDIVEKEMYSFKDKSGNQITLKPEGTAPVCRAYVEHGMHNQPQPVKLYYLTPVFRYEKPQAGRYRQHHQFGYEAIGEDNAALDAEVIDMAWRFFELLGLQHLSLLINSIGCRLCRPNYLTVLKQYYAQHRDKLCLNCKVRLEKNTLRLLDCKNPLCQQLAASSPRNNNCLCTNCEEHFNTLKKYLAQLGLPFEVNHCLVRGLDYYNRTVFEIQPENVGTQSTIGGGGRYDDLIEELSGKATPALGFATGIERIIINLKSQQVSIPPISQPEVFIIQVGDLAMDEAIKLASKLRQAGIGILQTSGSKSLKAQLRQANNLGAHYAVIIGEQEVATKSVILRDMNTAQQQKLLVTELQDKLQHQLK